jgi:hypothetical protein
MSRVKIAVWAQAIAVVVGVLLIADGVSMDSFSRILAGAFLLGGYVAMANDR